MAHWAAVIGGRYMGAERAEEYGRRNGVPGELLVRVRPPPSWPSPTWPADHGSAVSRVATERDRRHSGSVARTSPDW